MTSVGVEAGAAAGTTENVAMAAQEKKPAIVRGKRRRNKGKGGADSGKTKNMRRKVQMRMQPATNLAQDYPSFAAINKTPGKLSAISGASAAALSSKCAPEFPSNSSFSNL